MDYTRGIRRVGLQTTRQSEVSVVSRVLAYSPTLSSAVQVSGGILVQSQSSASTSAMLSYFNLNQVTQPPADLLQPFFPTQRTKRIHSFQKSGAHSFDVALMAMASEESRDLGGEDGRRRGTQESGKRRQLNETEETAMAQKNRKPIKYEGSKKEEEEDDEEFWTSVSALRNTKYGIAMVSERVMLAFLHFPSTVVHSLERRRPLAAGFHKMGSTCVRGGLGLGTSAFRLAGKANVCRLKLLI
jgi:hypothetical protein